MIVYVSGAYSGLVDINIQAAREVAIKLWEVGFSVITPHLNTAHMEVDCKASYEQYIEGDLEILSKCDAIVMVPNWKTSRGAKIEAGYAYSIGIPVYYYPEMPQHKETLPNREAKKFMFGVKQFLYTIHTEKEGANYG